MADHRHHHHHEHRPHRISLPPRAAIPTTTSSTPRPSHPFFRYPPSTPTPTPSKQRLPISRPSAAATSFSFLFLLLFSLRSLYSLLPFLRSSPPSFSIFPFSFLVSLLSFLLTLSFSLFASSFAKNSSYLKSQRPIFSLTSITQSQLKLLVAKSILLAVVFLLRFQALRYCGTAAMILAELSGNVVSRFMTDGKDRSFVNVNSIGSSKEPGLGFFRLTPRSLYFLSLVSPWLAISSTLAKGYRTWLKCFLSGSTRSGSLQYMSLRSPVSSKFLYLKEDKPHGSGGSLYYFRDEIMEESPSHIFMLNHDVCCSFPLPNMLEAHMSYGGMGTILVIKVSAESAHQFGELVADPVTKELLHYTEKPETFVSDLINCGVYVFTPQIFSAIEEVYLHMEDRADINRASNFELQLGTRCYLCLLLFFWYDNESLDIPVLSNQSYRSLPTDFVRLDQDILSPLAGMKQLYTYETMDFWEQIKTPGMAIECSALYLAQFRSTSPHLLANGDGKKNAMVVGDVYIHPSAKVHPTAKIGPNVSISANVRIAAGARLISCIVLDDVEIKENAVIMHAIVGRKSFLGRWSRVQADGDYNAKFGITILGEAVTVEDEVAVINSIVLPNKMLNSWQGSSMAFLMKSLSISYLGLFFSLFAFTKGAGFLELCNFRIG